MGPLTTVIALSAAAGTLTFTGAVNPLLSEVRLAAMSYELSAVARYAHYESIVSSSTPHEVLQAALDAWSPTLAVPTLHGPTLTYRSATGECLQLTAISGGVDSLRTAVTPCPE